jgi:hypothetical protein
MGVGSTGGGKGEVSASVGTVAVSSTAGGVLSSVIVMLES